MNNPAVGFVERVALFEAVCPWPEPAVTQPATTQVS
jgi:hypothetical protein